MAATDPVRSIREATSDHPVISDLDAALQRLAALPPSAETPYLTAYLDWRPDGDTPRLRQSLTEAANAAAAILAEQEKRSASLASLNADVEAITTAITTSQNRRRHCEPGPWSRC